MSHEPDDDPAQNPARAAVLHELRRSALEVYGEERAADRVLRTALEVAATALWRVMAEPLSPPEVEPFGLD
jgi:hypothetical protein